jgi:copper transport protein
MKRAFFVVVVAFVALVALAAPAFAHATLESSDPAGGTQLPAGQPPKAITLTFDEGVQIPPDAVRMFDSDGKTVAIGAPTHGDSSSVVTAAVPTIADGTYVVSWRVVSDDAHPVSGGFTFSVGKATAGTGSAAIADILGANQGDKAVGVVFGVDRMLAFLSVLVFAGGVFFIRTLWPEAAERRPVVVLLVVAWATVIVTALAGIGLEAAYGSGRGFSAMFDSELIRQVLRSHFGEAWLARAILAAALFPFARRPRWGTGPVVDVALALAGLALVGTISYGGHATTGRGVALAFVTDLVHVSGAAVWLGGLSILALALWLPARARGAPLATSRFSRIAAPAIGLVALSGVLQATRQIESWSALLHTTYGRLLIAKVFCVGVIVVAASASRDIVRTRLMPRMTPAMGPGAAHVEADEHDVRNLRDAVLFEVAVAIIVLAITAVLVNTQPARAVATGGSYTTTAKTAEMWFDVTVSPAKAGSNRVTVLPRVPDSGAASVLEVTAKFSNSERGIAPITVLLTTEGPFNTTYGGDVTLPFPGSWTLDIRALRTQVDESAVQLTVPVS